MQSCKYELGSLWLTSASYKHTSQSKAENRARNSVIIVPCSAISDSQNSLE